MIPLLLGDLFELKYGKSLRKDTRNEGDVPVFGSNGQVDFHSESLVDQPTIIVGRKGSIGEVHLVKTPCWPIDTTYFVEPLGKHELDLDWLYRLLRTLRLQELNRSAAVPGLNRDDVYRIPILLPSLDDQIRIAYLLDKVEGLIAQRKQHLQQLDDLLKSVFLEMFGDPVRNEMGWDVVPFNKVGQFISGGTPSKSRDDYWCGTFPWVSPKDMKVTKIDDAEDHISEAVFEETSLKRIAPGHLLIVVRGMILAHSFPVAINTVEIAINQDMKAINPFSGISVIYLQSCLVSLKRQIMKLITTAGHGTRKFESIAMQKLLIPKPPEPLQNQFADIVEKVEGIKSRYQQCLIDLENLYNTLSQQVFKRELDLSSVPLPAMSDEGATS